MSDFILTSNEIELLKKTFAGFSEGNENGLDESETELILQMRSVNDYLKEKYGERNFSITIAQPENALNAVANFFFMEEGDTEVYKAQIRHEGENNIISDNYYAHLLKPAYNDWLNKLFADTLHSDTAIQSKSAFALLNSELTGTEPAEEIAKLGNVIGAMTNIRVSESDKVSELLKAIQKIIVDNKIYGFYTVSVNGKIVDSFNMNGIK